VLKPKLTAVEKRVRARKNELFKWFKKLLPTKIISPAEKEKFFYRGYISIEWLLAIKKAKVTKVDRQRLDYLLINIYEDRFPKKKK
jgi:hypothetical protein